MPKLAMQEVWAWLLRRPKMVKPLRSQKKFRELYPDYEIGPWSYGVPVVRDWQEGTTLRIGAYCSIARNVQIFLGGNHRTDWISSYPFPAFFAEASHIKDFGGSNGDVIIGSDVWLCSNCIILSGVTIGHGAVIASGAVISRDVEPYAIMAGNPAQCVRWRFDEPTRQILLASEWWTWPEEEIRRTIDQLCSNDIARFLAYVQARNAI